eukprot:1376564-Amorphochlora_amoeboformis.AAC.1
MKKLPGWILQYLDTAHTNLSTDACVSVARKFLKDMGQPRSLKDEIGVTMLSQKQIYSRFANESKFAGGFAENEHDGKESKKTTVRTLKVKPMVEDELDLIN